MRILLDTHIFLWCISDDKKLSKSARAKISEASQVFISSASIWEAIIKIQLGKLEANPKDLVESIVACGFIELPVTASHAAALMALPDIHKDPFDRMLIAQAISEPLIFLTKDPILKAYSELIDLID